jgi:hypothetical protein
MIIESTQDNMTCHNETIILSHDSPYATLFLECLASEQTGPWQSPASQMPLSGMHVAMGFDGEWEVRGPHSITVSESPDGNLNISLTLEVMCLLCEFIDGQARTSMSIFFPNW